MSSISVVVSTFNRPALLERLLHQLATQSLPADQYEVVVVDDGSTPPVGPRLRSLALPFSLQIIEQPNAGAAAARHAGALSALGELLVFVDDDMQVGPHFLREHQKPHLSGERVVVLGRICADPEIGSMPLFERWHARLLDRLAADAQSGAVELTGLHLFSGNFSVARRDYLEVGGFDATLGQAEDSELGMRLERAGVRFCFSEAAWTRHGSDHTSLERWRSRAGRYGAHDVRIARKHPTLRQASPWHYLYVLQPVTRPLLLATLLDPALGAHVASASLTVAMGLDRLGLERPALAGTTLAYALEYFRGARDELGSAATCVEDVIRYVGRFEKGSLARLCRWYAETREDQAIMRHYQARYGHSHPSRDALGEDLVHKIGLQMMAVYRAMRILRDDGNLVAAKVLSRLIRHLYGSDIHWDADFEPGVMIVHGMGMAISGAARVERGATLFHGITLGMGIDPITRRTGAPHVGRDVSVGPGATLLGPISIGEGSKIMAGAVVTTSVPPRSIVEPVMPNVRMRSPREEARAG